MHVPRSQAEMDELKANKRLLDAFDALYVRGDGCWPWIGPTMRQGKRRSEDTSDGQFIFGWLSVGARRFKTMLEVGWLPSNMYVVRNKDVCTDHRCVRPSHMRQVRAKPADYSKKLYNPVEVHLLALGGHSDEDISAKTGASVLQVQRTKVGEYHQAAYDKVCRQFGVEELPYGDSRRRKVRHG